MPLLISSGAAITGALIGFTLGMIMGHTYEYEFKNIQQQENSNK